MTLLSRCSRYCVTPPHILKHMAEKGRHAEVREAGLRALVIASRIRTRRRFIGLIPASASTGVLHRNIFDAKHSPDCCV